MYIFVVVEKNKNPQNATNLNIETFGTSVNILTNQIFKKKNTIGNYALNKMEIYRKRYMDGEESEKIIQEINAKLGDSLEKLLLIKEINNNKK